MAIPELRWPCLIFPETNRLREKAKHDVIYRRMQKRGSTSTNETRVTGNIENQITEHSISDIGGVAVVLRAEQCQRADGLYLAIQVALRD